MLFKDYPTDSYTLKDLPPNYLVTNLGQKYFRPRNERVVKGNNKHRLQYNLMNGLFYL